MPYQYKYNRTLLNYSRSNRKEQTDAERVLWHYLRSRSLVGFKFRRQYPLFNYILDFYCVEKKLAVELDGSQHIRKEAYDKRRTAQLQKLGIQILRFWDNDVLINTDIVLEEIHKVLTSSTL